MADQAPTGHDPDDWWDAPAQPPRTPGQLGDDWLIEQPREPRSAFGFPTTLTLRTLLLLGGGVVALLIVLGLLLAGAFSGDKPRATPPTTSPVTTTAQTPTTPTTPTTPAVQAPTVTLKPGASGPQTKRLQRALASLGFKSGAVDGTYGPATTAAVKKFQQSVKLTADGVVGPKTLAALRTALKG